MSRRIWNLESNSVYRVRAIYTGVITRNRYEMAYGPYLTLSAAKATITRESRYASSNESSEWIIEVANEWSVVDV